MALRDFCLPAGPPMSEEKEDRKVPLPTHDCVVLFIGRFFFVWVVVCFVFFFFFFFVLLPPLYFAGHHFFFAIGAINPNSPDHFPVRMAWLSSSSLAQRAAGRTYLSELDCCQNSSDGPPILHSPSVVVF